MTYDEYKAFLLRTLRREGDDDLLADLDTIIRYGEDKLTRQLRTPFMTVQNHTLTLTGLSGALPVDYRSMRHAIDLPNKRPLLVTSLDNLTRLQRTASDLGEWLGYYAVVGQVIHVAGPVSVTPGVQLSIGYNRRCPSYLALATYHPFRETFGYSDLYDAAVLSETPMYLRDDARFPNWNAIYNEKLASANDEVAQLDWGSAPLGSMLPEGIA